MNPRPNTIASHVLLRVNDDHIDVHNSSALKTQITEAIERGNNRIIVDMSSVRFVDSSGLWVLLYGYKNAAQNDGELALSCLQRQVQSMFELTRLHRVFKIYPSIAKITVQS